MKNIKNNKTILAVIPAVVVLAAGVAFFCSRSGNTDKQCQETVERLQKLETADISSIEDAIRALSEKEKPTGSDSEEGVLGDILTDVQIKQAFQETVIVGDSITESIAEYGFLDTSIVVAKLGLRIDVADDQINKSRGITIVNFQVICSKGQEKYAWIKTDGGIDLVICFY